LIFVGGEMDIIREEFFDKEKDITIEYAKDGSGIEIQYTDRRNNFYSNIRFERGGLFHFYYKNENSGNEIREIFLSPLIEKYNYSSISDFVKNEDSKKEIIKYFSQMLSDLLKEVDKYEHE